MGGAQPSGDAAVSAGGNSRGSWRRRIELDQSRHTRSKGVRETKRGPGSNNFGPSHLGTE